MEKPKLTNNKVFKDERGTFAPLLFFNLNKEWIQSNISINPKKFTFRGLHFQNNEFAQTKLVKVIQGKITDFVVDIRENSKEYMVVQYFEMNEGDELILPKGFAHGFITTEDQTVVQYLVDNKYSPENEGGLFYGEFITILDYFDKLDEFDYKKLIINKKDKKTNNFKVYNLNL